MYGMPSCYNSGLTFARRFAESGIDITVACDQDISGPAARAKLKFFHLEDLSESKIGKRSRDIKNQVAAEQPGIIGKFIRLLREYIVLRQQTLANDELLQLIDELKPDVLLIDIECHLAIIASSTLAVPTALCSRLFDHRPGGFRPPLHKNLIPSQNPIKKLHIAMQWWILRCQSLFIAVRQSLSPNRLKPIHYRSSSMVDIKAIARHYNVDLWSIATTAHWFRPVTYHHVPIFSMTLESLDFEHASDDKFTYIGPMIDGQDYAFDFERYAPLQLEQFLGSARSKGQSVIYCAMGTFAIREPRFVEALRTLAQSRPDFALIIALGGRESAKYYPNFPSNALLMDFAPQLECLTQADAAILHSGIASLQEALMYRVPLMIFSVDSMDQNGTATRWNSLGLATRFSLDTVTTDMIGSELDRMLVDANLADRLKTYSLMAEQSFDSFAPEQLILELNT